MKTRVTELFGINYPIVLSGMSWISVPSMVAAVSNAGGLGILATGPLNASETRESIREIRRLTDRPFGANATLMFPGAHENARVLLEEKVPVINFSLGKGDWLAKGAHAYGGKVIATVVNERHARRAREQGADGLIVTGHEAAAHGGDATSLVLIPAVADAVDIPIIAAGGFIDGRGLIAALAMGAEGIAMGTGFMSTRESPLHSTYKNLSLEKTIDDTIYGPYFDGLGCRSMATPAAERAYRKGIMGMPNFLAAFVNSRDIAKSLGLPFYKLFLGVVASGWKNAKMLAYLANAFKMIRIATEDGDLKEGVLPVGQCQGLIHDIPTVAELIERIVSQASAIPARLEKAMEGD
ncbi:MAG: nitronate monooxygenase [Syntrophales bacterium]|nr:nitronate monooxygenase [Syntrophales bacterium]